MISQIPVSGTPPPHLYYSSAIFDSSNSRILTYGGFNSDLNSISSSLYSFNILNNTWQRQLPMYSDTTLSLKSHRLYLRSDQTILLFFGETSTQISSGVYSFNLNTYLWTVEKLTGDPVSGRTNFAFTHFTYLGTDYVAIFGGLAKEGLSNDLFM